VSARRREANHLVRFLRKLFGWQRSDEMAEVEGHLKVIKARMPDHIVVAHQRSQILDSTICGCFYCRWHFSAVNNYELG
jgi:hypothetical protein